MQLHNPLQADFVLPSPIERKISAYVIERAGRDYLDLILNLYVAKLG